MFFHSRPLLIALIGLTVLIELVPFLWPAAFINMHPVIGFSYDIVGSIIPLLTGLNLGVWYKERAKPPEFHAFIANQRQSPMTTYVSAVILGFTKTLTSWFSPKPSKNPDNFLNVEAPHKPSLMKRYTNLNSEIVRIGHILGLRHGVILQEGDMKYWTNTEVEYTSNTIRYLNEKLNHFEPQSEEQKWSAVKDVYRDSKSDQEHFASAGLVNSLLFSNTFRSKHQIIQSQLTRYQNDKPLYIASGWRDHDIGISFHKGYMVITNRGMRGISFEGSIVYKLAQQPDASDLKALQKIERLAILSYPANYHDVKLVLDKLKGEKVASFAQKPQKKGTCSFVNKLSSVEAQLCLVSLDHAGKLNDDNIRAYVQNSDNRTNYKEFTKEVRTSEMDRILLLIDDAEHSGNQEQLKVMVEIAYSVAEKIYLRNIIHPNMREYEVKQAIHFMSMVQKHKDLLNEFHQSDLSNLSWRLNRLSRIRSPRHKELIKSHWLTSTVQYHRCLIEKILDPNALIKQDHKPELGNIKSYELYAKAFNKKATSLSLSQRADLERVLRVVSRKLGEIEERSKTRAFSVSRFSLDIVGLYYNDIPKLMESQTKASQASLVLLEFINKDLYNTSQEIRQSCHDWKKPDTPRL